MNISKEKVEIMVGAITEDARIQLETAGVEDFENNDQHKRCLKLIGNRYEAREECNAALERIGQYEDAIRNGESLPMCGDNASASPLNTAMAFFETAVNEDDAATRKELYGMMRYIADYFETAESLNNQPVAQMS